MTDLSKAFANKRVMVTGGLGFIGSNLCHELVKLGADVLIVDSLIPEYGGNLFNIADIEDAVQTNIADVRDENGMKYLVRGQDYIFNLAGQVSHLDSMKDPHTDLEINCRSQLTTLEACRKNNPDVKILFAGTRGQYGKIRSLPVTEDHLLQPTDVNGINKTAGEWYHILYNNVHGIRATSLRLTNTYGPRQYMRSSRQAFLSWFIRLAVEDRNMTIYGDGNQLRDFNYIDDVAQAFLMAAATEETNGQVYNIGAGIPISVREAAELLIEVAGSGSLEFIPFPEDKRKIEIGDYYADYSKFHKATGWAPKVSFEEGLRRTVEYYREHWRHYWEVEKEDDSHT